MKKTAIVIFVLALSLTNAALQELPELPSLPNLSPSLPELPSLSGPDPEEEKYIQERERNLRLLAQEYWDNLPISPGLLLPKGDKLQFLMYAMAHIESSNNHGIRPSPAGAQGWLQFTLPRFNQCRDRYEAKYSRLSEPDRTFPGTRKSQELIGRDELERLYDLYNGSLEDIVCDWYAGESIAANQRSGNWNKASVTFDSRTGKYVTFPSPREHVELVMARFHQLVVIDHLSMPCHGQLMAKFDHGHKGIDIDGHIGDPIYASGDGTITLSQFDGPEGNHIVIDHGYGVKTSYSHASQLLVKSGDKVSKGQIIGLIGNTGQVIPINEDGSHVHFAMIVDGKPVDPLAYILKDEYANNAK